MGLKSIFVVERFSMENRTFKGKQTEEVCKVLGCGSFYFGKKFFWKLAPPFWKAVQRAIGRRSLNFRNPRIFELFKDSPFIAQLAGHILQAPSLIK